MSIRKFRSGRVPNATASTWVGEVGTMFYDETTGQLKIADGHTPGGRYINLVVATTTQLGGIKAGPGANVSVDGTLTIDTTGIPLSIGDLYIAQANISAVNANEDLNFFTNGTGNINLIGNLHVYATSQSVNATPILEARNDGNVYVNGNLITNGGTYHNGNVAFIGDTTHLGNLYITGDTVNNGLSVFNGDITMTGNAAIVGNTKITGNTLVTGTTTVTGSAFLTGNSYVTGNTLVTGTTTVAGNTLVTGNTTVTGNTSVVGATYLTGNSYVTGNTFVTGTTTVSGNTYVTGAVTTITGNTYLTGNSFVTGTVNVTGNSYITGNTFVQGPTTVTGNITVTGNSVQTGLSTFVVSQQNSTIGAVEITGDTNGLSQTPITTGVMLHITGQASLPSRIYNDAMNNYALYVGRRFNGTISSPTAVLANDDIMRFAGGVYTSAGWANIGPSRISFVSSENQTGTNQGGRIELWTTANSAGPAYANIQRIATVDAAVGVQATQFTTTGNVTAGNIAVSASGTLSTPRVILNDGGVRQLTGNTSVTLDFSTDSMVSLTNPTGTVTITLANYTAGSIIRFIYSSATARTINLGVAAAVNSTTGGTTLLSTGGGAPVGPNQSVILTYYCVGGTAATTYVSASYV